MAPRKAARHSVGGRRVGPAAAIAGVLELEDDPWLRAGLQSVGGHPEEPSAQQLDPASVVRRLPTRQQSAGSIKRPATTKKRTAKTPNSPPALLGILRLLHA
jgi:hypothetical protein